jgi:hypothetical protein
LIGSELPNSAVDEVRTVIDHLSSLGVLHTDLHELLEGGVVAVVPILQLVEIRLDWAGYSLDRHLILYLDFIIRLNFKKHL